MKEGRVAKGIAELLLERGTAAVGRAAGAVLSDPRGQEALARAVGLAQRGLQVFSEAQERALHAAGLAARPDYDELRKQVARLKRKARELSAQLERTAPGAADPGASPHGSDGGSEEGGSH
jgi:hypothetical protein